MAASCLLKSLFKDVEFDKEEVCGTDDVDNAGKDEADSAAKVLDANVGDGGKGGNCGGGAVVEAVAQVESSFHQKTKKSMPRSEG